MAKIKFNSMMKQKDSTSNPYRKGKLASTAASSNKNTTTKNVSSKNRSKQVTDISRRQYKLAKRELDLAKTDAQLDLEKAKINAAARVANVGQVTSSAAGTVVGSTSIATQNQINGGLTNQGGLGRDDANSNNDGSKDDSDQGANSWEDIIGGLGKAL